MLRYVLLLTLLGHVFAGFKLLVLHTNDMHSRFQPTDRHISVCEDSNPANCFGGMARVKSVAEIKKKEAAVKGRETVFLNAGDNFQGTPFYTLFKWKPFGDVIDKIGFDAMALGNHEFDDGLAGLVPYIKSLKTPQVCANIDISEEPSLDIPQLTKSIVLERKGVKIGIIGFLAPDTKIFSQTGRVIFSEEITAIRKECRRLQELGVNILIAVGHSGYVHEIDIAREVEEIDAVVGGHSHTFLYSGSPPDVEIPKGPYPTIVTQESGKKVPVVQAYFGTKYLGYLELDFDDLGNVVHWEGAPILLSGNLPEDRGIVDIVSKYANTIKEKTSKIVGNAKATELDNNEMKCRQGECNIGNLVTDAMVDYVKRYQDTSTGYDPNSASIAIAHAGNIRASIDGRYNDGAISLGDVMTVIPWGAKVVILTLSGRSLLDALEFSVARYEQSAVGHVREYLQVSGLHVVFDVSRRVGHRVVSAKAVCAESRVPHYFPVDPHKRYKVVMPEYIASGGDGFNMLQSITPPVVLKDVDYVVLQKYLTNHSPVYPALQGRTVLIGTEVALDRGEEALEESTHTTKGTLAKRLAKWGALGTVVTLALGFTAHLARTRLF